MKMEMPDRTMVLKIIRFGMVGLVTSVFYMVIFYFMLQLTTLVAAAIICYIIVTITNYLMQSIFTFRQKSRDLSKFVRFFLMHMVCMSFNATMVWLLVNQFGLDAMISQASMVLPTAALSFVLANRWVFVRTASGH